jgi:hypothetical protein
MVHDAFGPSRRAAGVVDGQQLALVDRCGSRLVGVRDPGLVGVIGSAGDEARQVSPVGQLARAVGELVGRDQDRRAGVGQ